MSTPLRKAPGPQRGFDLTIFWLWGDSRNHSNTAHPCTLVAYMHTMQSHCMFPLLPFLWGGKKRAGFVLNTHLNMCVALKGMTNVPGTCCHAWRVNSICLIFPAAGEQKHFIPDASATGNKISGFYQCAPHVVHQTLPLRASFKCFLGGKKKRIWR